MNSKFTDPHLKSVDVDYLSKKKKHFIKQNSGTRKHFYIGLVLSNGFLFLINKKLKTEKSESICKPLSQKLVGLSNELEIRHLN